jgi:hypothetical protein
MSISIIKVINPLGSSSLIGVPSGEKGGVNSRTKINMSTSNAFPMVPI